MPPSPDSTTIDVLLQAALDALLQGEPALALERAQRAQVQAAAAGPPLPEGWARWLIAVARLLAGQLAAAEEQLAAADTIALASNHGGLRTAVYLARQLADAYTRQQSIRHHVNGLLRELEENEARITRQFRTMADLAAEMRAASSAGVLSPTTPPPGLPAATSHLPPLEVHCLGPFRIWQAGQELRLGGARKALDIFKYLLAHGKRPVPKETLIQLFWAASADDRRGPHRLQLAISTLRRLLNPQESENTDYILYADDAYRLHPNAPIQLDVEQFVQLYNRAVALERAGRGAEAQATCESALALYGGDYLAENLYDDWTAATREHLRQLYLTTLVRLGGAYLRQGREDEGAVLARRLLLAEPCHEEGHRLLMLAYSRSGQRTQALRQYHLYAETLRREFGADPAPALADLYREIAGQSD